MTIEEAIKITDRLCGEKARDRGLAAELVLTKLVKELGKERSRLRSLALVEMPKDTVGRYRFHDLVREFGRGKLEDNREEELTEQSLEWYDVPLLCNATSSSAPSKHSDVTDRSTDSIGSNSSQLDHYPIAVV